MGQLLPIGISTAQSSKLIEGWKELEKMSGMSRPDLKRVMCYYGFPKGFRKDKTGFMYWEYEKVKEWVLNEAENRTKFQNGKNG